MARRSLQAFPSILDASGDSCSLCLRVYWQPRIHGIARNGFGHVGESFEANECLWHYL
jgi:hypothetical protein